MHSIQPVSKENLDFRSVRHGEPHMILIPKFLRGAEDNAIHNALANLTGTSSRNHLLDLIEDALEEENESSRQTKRKAVQNYYHEQAMTVPLWGCRVVAILNSRLSDYEPGHQQFDFPDRFLDQLR